MITTTLNRIRAHRPCARGWEKLLRGLGKTEADDDPLPYARIVEINGLDDALWCCCAEPQHAREWRLFAVWCARQVQHLMTDVHSLVALDVVERYAHDQATDADLGAARDAAEDAAWTAEAAAWPAEVAAEAAARDAARAAAWSAAWAAAWDAAWAAEKSAVWATERAKQKAEFLRIVGSEA